MKKDLHAEAFKQAFESAFKVDYNWSTGDFVHLSKFREQNPNVTPEEFAATAVVEWGRGRFASVYSLTIKGMASHWPQIKARHVLEKRTEKPKVSFWELKEKLKAVEAEIEKIKPDYPSDDWASKNPKTHAKLKSLRQKRMELREKMIESD
jgi:hypothetical protein